MTQRQFCDLVMEGGITSGVVYPSAVVKLAEHYYFRNIGGTSAGAIAAAATAAAELYRRREAAGLEPARTEPRGFDVLAALPGELATGAPESKLFTLFQPQPETMPLFRMLSGSLNRKRTITRALALVGYGLLGFWLPSAVFAALVATTAALSSLVTPFAWFPWLLLTAAGALVGMGFGIFRCVTLDVVENGFGLCRGVSDDEASEPLVLWLSRLIDRCAGRELDQEPVTFGDLAAAPGFPPPWLSPAAPTVPSIRLQMITTNLTHGRPYCFPLSGPDRFFFKKCELSRYFPQHIVEHLVAKSPAYQRLAGEPLEKPADLLLLPKADDLPIVFAARLSLSFPFLISAVPLWTTDFEAPRNDRVFRRCWFSDGGIASNFPIHFFDTGALPLWPTFGIQLESRKAIDPTSKYGQRVWMPARNAEGRADPWMLDDERSNFSRFAQFVTTIFQTAQGWRDRSLARTVGVRDRVVRVRLQEDEGGLNLKMEENTQEQLVKAGADAGQELVNRFVHRKVPTPDGVHAMDFDNHRWMRTRALVAAMETQMSALERSLAVVPPNATALPDLAQRVPVATDTSNDAYCVPAAIAQNLRQVTASLAALAATLDRAPTANTAPPRRPVVRLVPDI